MELSEFFEKLGGKSPCYVMPIDKFLTSSHELVKIYLNRSYKDINDGPYVYALVSNVDQVVNFKEMLINNDYLQTNNEFVRIFKLCHYDAKTRTICDMTDDLFDHIMFYIETSNAELFVKQTCYRSDMITHIDVVGSAKIFMQ